LSFSTLSFIYGIIYYDFLLNVAIALPNKLRFKAKFSILAIIFYIPIIASGWWIVGEQWQPISQYDSEISGLTLVNETALTEQFLRINSDDNDVESNIMSLGDKIKKFLVS
jgi:methyl-accepting chemotaxis protein